jgi:ABC-type histidine transport system ATPase subunit
MSRHTPASKADIDDLKKLIGDDINLVTMQREEIDQLKAEKLALREMLHNLWPSMCALSNIIETPNIALGITEEGAKVTKKLISNMEKVLRETR